MMVSVKFINQVRISVCEISDSHGISLCETAIAMALTWDWTFFIDRMIHLSLGGRKRIKVITWEGELTVNQSENNSAWKHHNDYYRNSHSTVFSSSLEIESEFCQCGISKFFFVGILLLKIFCF